MKQFYFYNVIRKNIIQFLDLFNDIKIGRYNQNGQLVKLVKVPIKFGPKQKVWYWLTERKDDETLPIIGVSLTGIEYDVNRQGNKMHDVLKSRTPSAGQLESFKNPIPYNMNFKITIWSLHMIDIDSILEQILPYFSPSITMRINIPEVGVNIESKVTFNSAIPDVNELMADDEHRIIKWDLDFTIQTYLFQPLNIVGGDNGGYVEKLIVRFYTDKDVYDEFKYLDCGNATNSTFTSGASGHEAESLLIKGIPPWSDNDTRKYLKYERWDDKDLFERQDWVDFQDNKEGGVYWDSKFVNTDGEG